jgi:hypothetical protein
LSKEISPEQFCTHFRSRQNSSAPASTYYFSYEQSAKADQNFSLVLPDDASTLVPLDSSIRSQKVEQMGFMSWIHAWRTFSRASWVRIVKIYAKIFATTILVEFAVSGLIIAQALLYSVVMQPKTAAH